MKIFNNKRSLILEIYDTFWYLVMDVHVASTAKALVVRRHGSPNVRFETVTVQLFLP